MLRYALNEKTFLSLPLANPYPFVKVNPVTHSNAQALDYYRRRILGIINRRKGKEGKSREKNTD